MLLTERNHLINVNQSTSACLLAVFNNLIYLNMGAKGGGGEEGMSVPPIWKRYYHSTPSTAFSTCKGDIIAGTSLQQPLF